MSIPLTQPIATRSGLPLAGRLVKPRLTGRDDLAGAHRAWDDQTALPVAGYPVGARTDQFGSDGVVRFENSTPSDIRVTTRGIPV